MSQQVSSNNYYNDLAKGLVAGSTIANQLGTLPSGPTGTYDIWSWGRDVLSYTPPAGATIDTISSSSTLDVGIPIAIIGLGANFEELPPVVAVLNGQNKVSLPAPLRRINVVRNFSGTPTGTTATDLIGEVFIYEDTPISSGVPIDPNKVKEHIPIGGNISKHAFFTVPAGKSLNINTFYGTLNTTGAGGATLEGYQQTAGETKLSVLEFSVQNTGSTFPTIYPTIPYFIPEKTDVSLQAVVTSNGVGVSFSTRGEIY